jgi:hypothetical protein
LTKNKKRYKRQAKNDSDANLDSYYKDYFNFYGSETFDKDNVKQEYDDDTIDDLPRDIYCDLVGTLKEQCLENRGVIN